MHPGCLLDLTHTHILEGSALIHCFLHTNPEISWANTTFFGSSGNIGWNLLAGRDHCRILGFCFMISPSHSWISLSPLQLHSCCKVIVSFCSFIIHILLLHKVKAIVIIAEDLCIHPIELFKCGFCMILDKVTLCYEIRAV